MKKSGFYVQNTWLLSCATSRVEPGIRVTLTLRGSKIAWGGPSTRKLHQSLPFGPRDSGKILKFGSPPSIVVKSDTPPSIETSTRNKGHRSKIAFMSTEYRTHAKWWGIAGDARRERALSPHVFRHFLHFFLVEIVLDVRNNGSYTRAGKGKEWRLFIFISRESKWGTLKSAGNPRCAVPAESHSICTDRRRPGPAAALQVSPTSDTCQSVAILMNRPHSLIRKWKISDPPPPRPRWGLTLIPGSTLQWISLFFTQNVEQLLTKNLW